VLAVIEIISRDLARKADLDYSFEEVDREFEHLVNQLTTEELRVYLKESLFMSFNRFENERLLTVVRSDVLLMADFFISATAEIEKILQAEADRAAVRLRELVPLLAAAHLSVTTRVERGDARSTIVEIAESEHCDLVVVGSHGRTGFHRLVLGSVAAHVVAHAACDVLVVKPAAGSREPERKDQA